MRHGPKPRSATDGVDVAGIARTGRASGPAARPHDMTIFFRSALREFANNAFGVFAALFAVMLTTQLVRLLSQAASGKIASEAVLAFLGFAALNYLPVLLSLTLFIAILIGLTRSYRDSEMTIWFSSGLPLHAWVRPVLAFSLPMVAVIAVLSLFLSPWAVAKRAEYRNQLDSRDDLAQMSPGSFRESASADRIFFVEAGDDKAGRVSNVFVATRQHGRLGVMVAADGYVQTFPNGDRFVVLLNGRRYEGEPGSAEYRRMEFESYAVRIETREAAGLEGSPKYLPIWELIRQPTAENLGEVLWRFGLPLSALNLALLAVPMSFVNPRAGRTNNLLMALLIYMAYTNLIGVCQAWVAQGKLAFGIGFWAVHLLMLVFLLAAFYRRIRIHSGFKWPHRPAH